MIEAILKKRSKRLLDLRSKLLKKATPELIHDVRVATRRLQEAVEFLEPHLAPDSAKKLHHRARKIRKQLSAAREADVMTALLQDLEYGDQVEFHRDRHAHHSKNRLPKIRKQVQKITKRLQSTSPGNVFHQAELSARARLQDVSYAMKDAENGESSSLHTLRIAIKKFRYMMEIVRELDIPADEIIAHCKSLQEVLGDLHDLDVLLAWLEAHPKRVRDMTILSDLQNRRRNQLRSVQIRLRAFRIEKIRTTLASMFRKGREVA